MTQGYVYVLVNSSMPGLLKVGKTTRVPAERVAELSSATGVATPFVIAFQQHFADCHTAESAIHNELQRRGVRPSANREFFRASPETVIRLVMSMAEGMQFSSSGQIAHKDNDGELAQSPNERADKCEPWRDLLSEGFRHYCGIGNYLEDMERGVSLYKDAAMLGSSVAFEHLGHHYTFVDSLKSALDYYHSGAKLGKYYCHAGMAEIYFKQKHPDNGRKCYKLFFSHRLEWLVSEERYEELSSDQPAWLAEKLREEARFASTCRIYINDMRQFSLPIENLDEMRPYSDAILASMNEIIAQARDSNSPKAVIAFSKDAMWVKENLASPVAPTGSIAPVRLDQRSWLRRWLKRPSTQDS